MRMRRKAERGGVQNAGKGRQGLCGTPHSSPCAPHNSGASRGACRCSNGWPLLKAVVLSHLQFTASSEEVGKAGHPSALCFPSAQSWWGQLPGLGFQINPGLGVFIVLKCRHCLIVDWNFHWRFFSLFYSSSFLLLNVLAQHINTMCWSCGCHNKTALWFSTYNFVVCFRSQLKIERKLQFPSSCG